MIREDKNTVSRRSMLATTGAGAVVAGAAASPTNLFANSKGSSEIATWTKMIGQAFICQALDDGRSRSELKLLAVVPFEAEDPDRPKHFRAPFSLIFKRASSRSQFISARYVVSHRELGRNTLLLTEVKDMKSGEFVVEAVFS